MKMAHEIAYQSREKGRKVGCVIVDQHNNIKSSACNNFPNGVDENLPERHNKENGEKYFWSSHAERNAIYYAARKGIALEGCKIYVPWFPCSDCAKAIIQSGLTHLIAYAPDLDEPKWGEEFKKVVQMLEEGGVNIKYIPVIEELPNGN